MKPIVMLLVLAGSLVAQSAPTPSQTPAKTAPNPLLRLFGNGAWWTNLPDDVKDTFVDGYITAMAHVNFIVAHECADARNNLKPGPKFDADMQTAMALCATAEWWDFSVDERLDRQKVKNGIDAFYKDPQNTRITIDYAVEYTRDELKGRMSPRQLEDELKEWRQLVNK